MKNVSESTDFILTDEIVQQLHDLRARKNVKLDWDLFCLINQDVTNPERVNPEMQDRILRFLRGTQELFAEPNPFIKKKIPKTSKYVTFKLKPLTKLFLGLLEISLVCFIFYLYYNNYQLRLELKALQNSSSTDHSSTGHTEVQSTVIQPSENKDVPQKMIPQTWLDSVLVQNYSKLTPLFPLKTKWNNRMVLDTALLKQLSQVLNSRSDTIQYACQQLPPIDVFKTSATKVYFRFIIFPKPYYVGPIKLDIYKVEDNGNILNKIPIVSYMTYNDMPSVAFQQNVQKEIDDLYQLGIKTKKPFFKTGCYIVEVSIVDKSRSTPISFLPFFQIRNSQNPNLRYRTVTQYPVPGYSLFNLTVNGIPWKRVHNPLYFELVYDDELAAILQR